jgi:hypothetical protein
VEVQVLSSALIARSPARLRSGHDDFARYRCRGQTSLSGHRAKPVAAARLVEVFK